MPGGESDIAEAIHAAQEALALTSTNDAEKPLRLSNLGTSLFSRYERFKDPPDVEEAITFQLQASKLVPDGHADKATYLSNLGNSYASRWNNIRNPADIDAATKYFMESARSSSAPPAVRFRSAQRWSEGWFTQHGTPLLEAHETIISLVPRIIWLGTDVSRRYEDILSIGDAVNEAAAAAIEVQQYDTALEWLEQGRSIVWGQILSLRTPMDELRAAGQGDLAHQLEHVSQELEKAGNTLPAMSNIPLESSVGSKEEQAQRHRRLAERYEELLAEVRRITGFERFLQPRQLSELCSATRSGPVAVINVHNRRCDALILRDKDVSLLHVALPASFTYETAKNLRLDLIKSLAEAGIRDRDDRASKKGVTKGAEKPSMQKVLEVIWTNVVSPVLFSLGYMVSEVGLHHFDSFLTTPFYRLRLQVERYLTSPGVLQGHSHFFPFTLQAFIQRMTNQKLSNTSYPHIHRP